MPVFLVHVVSNDLERLKPETDEKIVFPAATSKDWADFVPGLGPKENDIVIEKKQWGAFYGTGLELQLRRRKIDTIVLSGISTTYGVESTARFAYEFGFQQIFAEDAMASMSEESHNSTINFVFKRIGLVRKTAEILKSLSDND
jgi:nicotinamidase-related amidase